MREKESDLFVRISIEVLALEREKSREDDSRVCALSHSFLHILPLLRICVLILFPFFSVFLSVVKAVAVSARTHNLTSSTLDRWIFGVKFSFVRSLSLSLAYSYCVCIGLKIRKPERPNRVRKRYFRVYLCSFFSVFVF